MTAVSEPSPLAEGWAVTQASALPAGPGPVTLPGRIDELRARREKSRSGTGPKATEAQHARGKLTAHERIELLLDRDSFVEVGAFRRHRASGFGLEDRRPDTDGVITGWGTIDGRTVFLYAHDFRIFGGSLGEAHAEKIHKIMDMALAAKAPLIGLNDGAGARIQEGVTALAGYGGIFRRIVAASGVIPQISVMLGPCAGGAAYAPSLTDVVFMVRGTSQMFITGPDVVATVTGEKVTHDELGGAEAHSVKSGVATFVCDDEKICLEDVRYLVSLLPQNNQEMPPRATTLDDPDRSLSDIHRLVPANPTQAYDMSMVIHELLDDGEFLEFYDHWAQNVIVGLGRIGGQPVGIIANQPAVLAGVLDIAASQKAARFVQFCDSFNFPLVTLVDVPGFLPGIAQEHGGIIRHGAKLLYAYCNATVPRIQMVLRKAYGGAYIVMDSLSIGADLSFAWPINEIAVMGAEGAANVVFRKQIAAAPDPEATRLEMVARYKDQLMHPYYAAERGLVDEVVEPSATRSVLASALRMLRAKHVVLPYRKHGNPPM